MLGNPNLKDSRTLLLINKDLVSQELESLSKEETEEKSKEESEENDGTDGTGMLGNKKRVKEKKEGKGTKRNKSTEKSQKNKKINCFSRKEGGRKESDKRKKGIKMREKRFDFLCWLCLFSNNFFFQSQEKQIRFQF